MGVNLNISLYHFSLQNIPEEFILNYQEVLSVTFGSLVNLIYLSRIS